MDNKNTIAVILTVYNASEYLDATLSCFENLELFPDEMIIVDDGSSDNSLEICKRFQQKNPKVQVFSKRNSGPGSARNYGLERCLSEYVLFLDDDDYFAPSIIRKLKQEIMNSEVDVIVFMSKEINQVLPFSYHVPWYIRRQNLPNIKRVFHPSEVKNSVFNTFVGWAWDKLFRREFLFKKNISFPELRNSEDLVFTYSALVFAEYISVLDDVLVIHRSNRNSSVSSNLDKNPLDFYKAIVLLKRRIVEDRRVWTLYKDDFLIWAMHFTLWVASSNRRLCIDKKILLNELTELEFFGHSTDFYSFYPLDNFLLIHLHEWDSIKFRLCFALKKIFYSFSFNGFTYSLIRILYHLTSFVRKTN